MFLNCHSFHSLRFGTLSIDQLCDLGVQHGATAMALTDVNTTTGIHDFIRAAKLRGIKALVGVDYRNSDACLYVGLARNQSGFKELCEIRTRANLAAEDLPVRAPESHHCHWIYPLRNIPEKLRPNEWIGVQPHELNLLLRSEYQSKLSKMVILKSLTFEGRRDFELHQLLRCVHHNIVLSRLQADQIQHPGSHFENQDHLIRLYKRYPQLIYNTERIIEECNYEYDFQLPRNKKFFTGSPYGDRILLEQLALDGAKKRYAASNSEALTRIRSELDVVDKLGLGAYFLIAWDIIRYSQSRGFYHVGRGSGANSIISYCLGITDICPLELNLYFERFLNPSRSSPPDFDIDWSWKDRDEILSYMFKRFDPACTAFTGTIGTFKHRSIVRELGKVFGLPKEEMDVLSKSSADEHAIDSVVHKIHKYGQMLEGFPNLRSLHACGILISEEPLTNYSILEMPPKGFQTVQFDMYIAEEIGFDKLDILSQRGIGHINDCVEIIRENRSEEIDIHRINDFKYDDKLNRHLAEGKTLGCFYIESPAMRGLLRRLKCDNYPTLVAASSVIRPGVAKSGMMREYVFRHNYPDQFEYFHPVFEEQLGDTYGVMVYQEDVIKIAHHFAGLDLADADILRRAMSGKTRSKKEFDAVKLRFFENCQEKGYPDELSQEVYRQIESFAGYSFCKAHSASYSVESYQSLFLKVYYPIEFMVAVINNFGGFYRTEVYVHEARMSGAVIENPCVNRSNHLTRAIGKHIYLGFIHINGLGTQVGELIEKERAIHGDYKSLDDFIERVPIGLESIQRLIFVGAFRFTGLGKNELTFKVSLLKEEKVVEDRKLFNPETKPFVLPDLVRNPVEDAFDEIELLGFPTSYSPFQLLKTQYRGDTQVSNLLARKGKRVRMVAYLISRKHVPTNQGLMNFGTWIDSEGNLFDSTHFPRSLEKNPFAGGGCYLMEGIVDIDYNFPTLTVEKMAKLPFVPDPRYSDDDPESQQAMSKTLREDVSVTHRAPYPSAHEIGLPRHKLGDSKNRRDKIAVKNKKDLPAWMKKKKYLGKSKEAKPHAHRLMELGGGRDRPRAPKTEDDSETDLD